MTNTFTFFRANLPAKILGSMGFLFYLFILIGGQLLYNIVMVFAIHHCESTIGIHVSLPSEYFSHLPLYPIPLGCHRTLALGALLHALNSHWISVLHMVMYMFPCYYLKSFHPLLLKLSPKVCSLSVSFAALYIGSLVPFFQILYICVNIWYLSFSF